MGVVRTNALMTGSSSGSSGANGADLPTHLSSISANGGNKFVTLTIGYTNTNYVSGVQVNYKTGGYPASPSDGQSTSVSGAAASIKVTGLTNKLTYYFRVFLFNEVDGVKYYQTDITNARVTAIPRAVEITGITPIISASNHIVVDVSGTFTLTAPVGTRIIVGSGGDGGDSGGAYDENDNEDYYSGFSGQQSILKINGTTYNSGSSIDMISTKAGMVGGGGKGGAGGQGAKLSSGWKGSGGDGGHGGLPNGSGGDGGLGLRSGHGGSNGSNTDTGSSTGKGGIGDTPGIYCYGGQGGNGRGGNKGASAQYRGCKGGQGGKGGYVAEYTLTTDLLNAYCVLTIGAGGKGGAADENSYLDPNPGADGDNGILVIEWDN